MDIDNEIRNRIQKFLDSNTDASASVSILPDSSHQVVSHNDYDFPVSAFCWYERFDKARQQFLNGIGVGAPMPQELDDEITLQLLFDTVAYPRLMEQKVVASIEYDEIGKEVAHLMSWYEVITLVQSIYERLYERGAIDALESILEESQEPIGNPDSKYIETLVYLTQISDDFQSVIASSGLIDQRLVLLAKDFFPGAYEQYTSMNLYEHNVRVVDGKIGALSARTTLPVLIASEILHTSKNIHLLPAFTYIETVMSNAHLNPIDFPVEHDENEEYFTAMAATAGLHIVYVLSLMQANLLSR